MPKDSFYSICRVEESKDEQSFRFRGDGYAVIDATLYDKYAFSVSLKFRTLDENSLIFMAVSRGKVCSPAFNC